MVYVYVIYCGAYLWQLCVHISSADSAVHVGRGDCSCVVVRGCVFGIGVGLFCVRFGSVVGPYSILS